MRILNKTVILVTLLLQASAALPAQSSGPSPYPDAKATSDWPGKGPIRHFDWMTANRKSFWTAREADQGKIIFAGDSVIGGWKLQKDFAGKPVANRGIGGDVTRGLLFRFQEDVLDLHPKAIVLHIGGNDLTADGSVADVVSNYNAILDLAGKANPNTPVIVLAVLPHGIPTGDKAPNKGLVDYLKKVNTRIPLLNVQLAAMAEARKNVTFVDSYTLFLLPDGTLDVSQFNADQVHPTDAGHTKLGKLVSEALVKLKVL